MRNRQLGFISAGMAGLFFSAGVLILCAVKLGPVYAENIYVTEALKKLVLSNSDLSALSKKEIKTQLYKHMLINSVKGPAAASFSIKPMRDKIIISSVYEVRVPMVGNVDAVLTFKSQLDTSKPDKCCKYIIDVVHE